MATPTCAVIIEFCHSEELSSQRLFGTSDDLDSERDQTDSVHVKAASDKNTGMLQLERIIVSLENKFLPVHSSSAATFHFFIIMLSRL